jgi:hypothetical protein
MLILRHKKKTNATTSAEDRAEGDDKQVYHGPVGMYQPGNEMATNANVWEMEGHGRPALWELEAVQTRSGGNGGNGVKENEKIFVDSS